MNENLVCPIWGTVATVHPSQESGSDICFVDSPRAGGKYCISGNLSLGLVDRDIRFKARLTSWLLEQRRLGVERPQITEEIIEKMEHQRNLPVHERADSLLRLTRKTTPQIGEPVDLFGNVEAILVESESISESEVEFLLEFLLNKQWLKKYSSHYFIVTMDGYARLAELETTIDSSQAFVAMWFDESMKEIYEKGIRIGIEDAGYKALRIDRKDHTNKLDDEIIAEIRRSRFVVADFTHKDIETCKNKEERQRSGARGSVYYEAGFAHGLNIPVIFTCRADLIEKVHFDTRQYPHIPWERDKLEELQKKLADRISAVFGDGPNKTQDA